MNLSWGSITEEELKHLYYDKELSDRQIADLYQVSKGKVTYKRNKFGISIRNGIYEEFTQQHSEVFQELNGNAKKRLLKKENIDSISKAMTHYIFRNGPVEEMHANQQLSEEDMKKLNKYMVNRIAGVLTKIVDENWLQLEMLLHYYRYYGGKWDNAEPDMDEIDLLFKDGIKSIME